MSRQEVGPEDGLLDIGHLEVPHVPLVGKLRGHQPGPVAVDPGSACTNQLVP